MRILVHYDKPEVFGDVLESRHGDLEIAYCRDYEGLGAMLAAVRPEAMYAIKFPSPLPYPRDAVLASDSLRWLTVGGSGTDHIAPWDPAKLTVTNTAGVASDMMAQYAIGAMLAFSLDFPGFARRQRAREWVGDATVAPVDGRTVAIIGLGKTGLDVARRAKAFGLRTVGVRANPAPTENVDEVRGTDELPALLAMADFVVVCVPLTPATRGLIGTAAFDAMKPGAVLIDVSRGGVVDGAALVDALDAGALKGAALDVFETEPLPPDHPLWRYDNVIVTPHCSSVYDGWERRSMEFFADNLDRWRRGEALANVVDPARGY